MARNLLSMAVMLAAGAAAATAAAAAARSPGTTAVNLVPTAAPKPGEVLSYYCSWYAQNYATCDSGHAGGDVFVFGPRNHSQAAAPSTSTTAAAREMAAVPPATKGVFLNTSLIVEACKTAGGAEPVGRQKWVANADGSLTNAFVGGFATVYRCERQLPANPPPGHGRPLYVSKDADDTCGGVNQRFSINANGSVRTCPHTHTHAYMDAHTPGVAQTCLNLEA